MFSKGNSAEEKVTFLLHFLSSLLDERAKFYFSNNRWWRPAFIRTSGLFISLKRHQMASKG